MTDEMIMEQLSKGYITLVGGRRGYKNTSPSPDTGVDVTFCPIVTREEPNGRTRLIDSDKKVDVQLKSTRRRRVSVEGDCIGYDLDAKAHNDLVHRRTGAVIPLYLVLLIMPDDANDWLGVSPEQLAVRECAYWWWPDEDSALTDNESSVRIWIPRTQRVTIDFFPDRFTEFYGAGR